MTDSPRERVELARLIHALSDETITPEELQTLERCLLDDAEARTFYHQYVALDVEMSWLHADEPALPCGPVSPRPDSAADPAPVSERPDHTKIGLRRPRRGWRRAWWVAGLAAVAAMVLVVLSLFRPAAEPALARLVELTGEAQVLTAAGEPTQAAAGQDLFAGQTLLTGSPDGFAVVEYADGTRLELHSDTMAQLNLRRATDTDRGGKGVFLSRGLLHADVAHQPAGQPLVLATPHAQIRVLGTRFASAIDTDTTRVELEEGRVQLQRRADGKMLEVHKGFYAVATSRPDPLETIPLPRQLTRPRATLGPRAQDVAFSPEGTTLATAGKQGLVFLDPISGQKRAILPTQRPLRFLTYAPDGRTLATLGEDQMIRLWDVASGQERRAFKGAEKGLSRPAFSPDSRLLAMVEQKEPRRAIVRLWEVAGGIEQAPLEVKGELATALAFCPRGRLLAVGSNRGRVQLWDWTSGKPVSTIQGLRKRIDRLAFAPDGRWLAVPGQEHNDVSLWDMSSGAEDNRLRGCERPVTALAFSPDGQLLAAGTVDGNVILWRQDSGEQVLTIRAGKGGVHALAFAQDSRTLATAVGKQPVQLWDLGIPAQD